MLAADEREIGELEHEPEDVRGEEQQKAEEEVVIALANARVDPRTVVVEAGHAVPTNVAVLGPLSALGEAVGTEGATGRIRSDLLHFFSDLRLERVRREAFERDGLSATEQHKHEVGEQEKRNVQKGQP